LPRVIRVIYKNGVLKLLEPVQLREGEDVFVKLKTYEDRLWTFRNYRGIPGKAGKEEIKKLLLETKFERLRGVY